MSIILNINTATENAYLTIARNGEVIAVSFNPEQKNHAGFLQPAIEKLLQEATLTVRQLDAVAIAAGPGSYTGLRVGMASAKGLCYALQKPLITIGTLEIMAFAAIEQVTGASADQLFCPMIEARRMEVFTGLYDRNMNVLMAAQAMVLDEQSFHKYLLKNTLNFFGTGAKKWAALCIHQNATFLQVEDNTLAMSKLAERKYKAKHFADLAYCEPLYLKEFFNPAIKN